MSSNIMSLWARLAIIACGLLIIYSILRAIVRKKITETHGLFWLFPALAIVLGGAFPQIVIQLADWLGVAYPPTLVITLAVMLIYYLVFRCTLWISGVSMRVQELGMQVSMLNQENLQLLTKLEALEKEQQE